MHVPTPALTHRATAPDSAQPDFPLTPQGGGGGARVLHLLSCNIQTGIATHRYHHYFTHSWKHVLPCGQRLANLDRMARLFSDYDLVGLQETDAGSLRSGFINQTEYLAQKAHFPCWYNQTNRDLGKIAQHSIGVLSRLRFTEISEHRLPGTIPGRGALIVRFGDGAHPLVLLIVHLALGRRARERQLVFLSELIREFRYLILMGDLNCRSESREMDLLLRNVSLREPVHGLHTFPSWRPNRNIDHILVSPTLQVKSVNVLNHPLSDHLPIAMEVALPPEMKLDDQVVAPFTPASARSVGAR